MRILWSKEILEWYEKNNIKEDIELDGIHLDKPFIPKYKNSKRLEFNTKGNAKNLHVVVEKFLSAFPGWNECLIILTQWGVWPSVEDWPRFYSWRGKNGSKTSISEAPGHLFTIDDVIELKELLSQIFEFGWEGYMVLTSKSSSVDTMIFISHDGWLEANSDLDFHINN